MGFFRRHEVPSDTSEQVDKKEILAQKQLEFGRDIMDKLTEVVKNRADAETDASEIGPDFFPDCVKLVIDYSSGKSDAHLFSL